MLRPDRALGLSVRLIVSVLLSLATANAAEASHEFKDWLPVTATDWAAAENPDLKIHHAVILYDGNILDDSDPEGSTIHSCYLRVRVLDDKGLDEFRQQQIPYRKDWKVTRLEARTLKENGEIIPLTDKEIFEKTLISFGRSRIKAKAFAFKGAGPGDIVEYRYSIRRSDTAPPLIQMRHGFYTIQSDLTWYYYPQPTGYLSNLTEKELEGLTYRAAYLILNGKRFAVDRAQFPDDEKPEGIRITYKNLPALPDEPLTTSERDAAVLFVGYYDFPRREAKQPYWDRIADWYGSSVREFVKKQARLAGWMQEILSKERDFDRDLSDCFELIHRDIVNVDELSDNELPKEVRESENIDELLKNRMGTSYDLNALLVAMLQKLGYTATVFLSRDSSEGPFIPEWKSAEQFSSNGIGGVAVKRGEAIHFCLPYLSSATPEMLPWEICGTKALMLDLSEGRDYPDFLSMCDIPLAGSEGNEIVLSSRLRLDEEGRLSGRMNLTRGYRNDPFFLSSLVKMTKTGRKDACERIRGLALQSRLEWTADEESLSISAGTIAYSCSLQVDGLVEEAGDSKLCDLGSFRTDDFRFPADERESRIDFRYPRHYSSFVVLDLPAKSAVEDLAPPARMSERFAEYRMSETSDSNTVALSRTLTIPYALLVPTAAEKLRIFFQDLYRTAEQPTVIRQSPAP